MFSKNPVTFDGLHCYCKPCDSEYHKEWYVKNKEYKNKKSREWIGKNRERHNEICRNYLVRNRGME